MGIVHSTHCPSCISKGFSMFTNKTAVLGYLEPVIAIIFSVLLLNEHPGINSIAGSTHNVLRLSDLRTNQKRLP